MRNEIYTHSEGALTGIHSAWPAHERVLSPVTASSARKSSKKAPTRPRRRCSRASRMAALCGCPSSFMARSTAAANLRTQTFRS